MPWQSISPLTYLKALAEYRRDAIGFISQAPHVSATDLKDVRPLICLRFIFSIYGGHTGVARRCRLRDMSHRGQSHAIHGLGRRILAKSRQDGGRALIATALSLPLAACLGQSIALILTPWSAGQELKKYSPERYHGRQYRQRRLVTSRVSVRPISGPHLLMARRTPAQLGGGENAAKTTTAFGVTALIERARCRSCHRTCRLVIW